jgi:DNA-binding MarR family transcriptional regulator
VSTDQQDDHHDDAVDLLMATARLMTAVVAHTLGDLDQSVSVPQLRVMVMLHDRGPLNLTAIAEGLGVNPSNATRTCDRLVAAGLGRRRADPDDGRAVAVTLTAKGRRLVDSLLDARRAVLVELVRHLSDPEQKRLARGLSGFLESVDRTASDAGVHVGDSSLLTWIR